jgi:hypothetical protein
VHPEPRLVHFEAAADAILAAARARGGRAVVGITGAVAAGKSTLARRISACVVSTDHYLPDYDRTPEHLRDLPESSDLARLAQDLAELRAGRATSMPQAACSNSAASAPETVKLLVPRPSSVTTRSATFSRAVVLVFSTTAVLALARASAVGAVLVAVEGA